jgi:hypothetical protein
MESMKELRSFLLQLLFCFYFKKYTEKFVLNVSMHVPIQHELLHPGDADHEILKTLRKIVEQMNLSLKLPSDKIVNRQRNIHQKISGRRGRHHQIFFHCQITSIGPLLGVKEMDLAGDREIRTRTEEGRGKCVWCHHSSWSHM